MKWNIKENELKQSISSNNSMSFLTDDALTFHRFSEGSISIDGRRKSNDINSIHINDNNTINNHNKMLTTVIQTKENDKFSPAIWTTATSSPSSTINGNGLKKNSKRNGTSETKNEFQFISGNNPETSKITQNGSTAKLVGIEESIKQSKCSIFRGILLCLCLNLTYANIVRFPRELERHGSEFLIVYFILLIVIGLPIVLLEISLGQFLGQGSAHAWRASPFFRGASIVGRFASWLSSIWISLQAVIAILYIGMMCINSVPFNECSPTVKITNMSFYEPVANSGQKCLQQTFLFSILEKPFYFGHYMAIGLIFIWILSSLFTHNDKINRRSIFTLGFITLILLLIVTVWEIIKSINNNYIPSVLPFNINSLLTSSIWFNALIQMIFSTNIGIGALPVITGKFLYKGDAVKTSVIYIVLNILINAIGTAYFLTQFNYKTTSSSSHNILYPELLPHTIIYDKTLTETNSLLRRLIPGISYLMIFIASIISIIICIFTSSKLIKRSPTYIMCFTALVISIITLLCPNYLVPRILDSRIVGTLIICVLIFETISIAWIYGVKNVYTDLEFSIGRPILKMWILFWIIIPVLLAVILLWWTIILDKTDLAVNYLPRWVPVIFSLVIIIICACVQISKQVDYNFMSMIKATTKPSKNWGPSDPLVRHSWIQWRSVCEDTGERDFTLRRRGTRDYTNSIKRGQYPRYGTNKTSTPGSNSPNYSGSVFGDSIEEDMSVDKYPNYQLQNKKYPITSSGSGQTSYRSGRSSNDNNNKTIIDLTKKNFYTNSTDDNNKYNNVSRIDILPQEETTNYKISVVRNPMARADTTSYHQNNAAQQQHSTYNPDGYDNFEQHDDHICWRKYSGNSQEYSTEL